MHKNRRNVWVIYFVGFDDFDDVPEARIEPMCCKERIETTADSEQAWYDVRLGVLARGGELITILPDDEANAEAYRKATESEMLKKR